MDYAQHFKPNATPQTEQADPRQVPNSAGGFTFQVDKWQRLYRFLVLGTEGGTYYASEKKLTRENAKNVLACLDEDGPRAVGIIALVSDAGRAPKNDAAVFALALAASHKDDATRAAAYAVLPTVCRTGMHLFQFVAAVDGFRGWGRGLKRAVGNWYAAKSPSDLAYQVVKYQGKGDADKRWTHRDVLRLARLDPSDDKAALYRWIAAGKDGLAEREVKRGEEVSKYEAVGELPAFVAAFEELRATTELTRVLALIREHRFTHEMIPGDWAAKAEVWEALAEHMPMTALVRNLGKLTSAGVIAPMGQRMLAIADRIVNAEAIKKARLHPMQILSALMVYKQGHGEKGKLAWPPVPQIVDALDSAFYEAFQHVEPTGKNILLCLDISGSMGSGAIAGIPGLTPRVASAAMAMVTMRTEKHYGVLGFSDHLIPLPLSPKQRLDDVVKSIDGLPFGQTDCAQPMLWAKHHKLKADAFVILTDNETYAGTPHPHQALRDFRQDSGIDAKLVVQAMTATDFTIADPSDPGQLDIVGMDTATPAVLADFIRG